MTDANRELLTEALIDYVKKGHSLEKCVGFADGFEKALTLKDSINDRS